MELIKVKGHSNIIGNDMADILANMARDYNHDAELIEILDNPRTRGYWVKTNITNSDGTHSKRHINNLNDDLCKHCTKQLGKGHSNEDSIYFNIWKDLSKIMDGNLSNHFWINKVKDAELRTVLQYRTGTLWNKKIEQRNNAALKNPIHTDNLCPLCHQPDSGSHIAGGCSHPVMKSIVISRHNTIATAIMKEIAKGEKGTDLLVADTCSKEKHNKLLPTVPFQRIPNWVLPKTSKKNRLKMRPDGLLLRTYNVHRQNAFKRIKGKPMLDKPVHIIEVKITSDTNHDEMMIQAKQQHNKLLSQLHRHKYKHVSLHSLVFGVSGTIPKTMKTQLTELGIKDKDRLDKLLKSINIICVKYLHKLVIARRQLENSQND